MASFGIACIIGALVIAFCAFCLIGVMRDWGIPADASDDQWGL